MGQVVKSVEIGQMKLQVFPCKQTTDIRIPGTDTISTPDHEKLSG